MYRCSPLSEMKPTYNSVIMNTHLRQKVTCLKHFSTVPKEAFPWSLHQSLTSEIPSLRSLLLTSSNLMIPFVFPVSLVLMRVPCSSLEVLPIASDTMVRMKVAMFLLHITVRRL